MSVDGDEAERIMLNSLGVVVSDEWSILEVGTQREVTQRDGEPDVYGNIYPEVHTVGRRVTVTLYRPEN